MYTRFIEIRTVSAKIYLLKKSNQDVLSIPLLFFSLFQTIPVAMSQLRNVHAICPNEVLHFLLDLFKYNDNTKNKVSQIGF